MQNDYQQGFYLEFVFLSTINYIYKSHRNELTGLQSKSIDWFLCDGNIDLNPIRTGLFRAHKVPRGSFLPADYISR